MNWHAFIDGKHRASFAMPEDAAVYVGTLGQGTVYYGKSLVVWREGEESTGSACESYDEAANTMRSRMTSALSEMRQRL